MRISLCVAHRAVQYFSKSADVIHRLMNALRHVCLLDKRRKV